MHSLAHSSSRELLECPGLSSVLGRTVDAVPDGGAAAGAEAACRGEGCGVERTVASGGFLATGVTRCCCDADCLGAFSFSFSFSLASLVLDEEPPIAKVRWGKSREASLAATSLRCLSPQSEARAQQVGRVTGMARMAVLRAGAGSLLLRLRSLVAPRGGYAWMLRDFSRCWSLICE